MHHDADTSEKLHLDAGLDFNSVLIFVQCKCVSQF